MDKYNQRYEKKKICPKCNGKVYKVASFPIGGTPTKMVRPF